MLTRLFFLICGYLLLASCNNENGKQGIGGNEEMESIELEDSALTTAVDTTKLGNYILEEYIDSIQLNRAVNASRRDVFFIFGTFLSLEEDTLILNGLFAKKSKKKYSLLASDFYFDLSTNLSQDSITLHGLSYKVSFLEDKILFKGDKKTYSFRRMSPRENEIIDPRFGWGDLDDGLSQYFNEIVLKGNYLSGKDTISFGDSTTNLFGNSDLYKVRAFTGTLDPGPADYDVLFSKEMLCFRFYKGKLEFYETYSDTIMIGFEMRDKLYELTPIPTK